MLREFAPDVRVIVTPALVMAPCASLAIPPNTYSTENVLISVPQCFLWMSVLVENVRSATGPVRSAWVLQRRIALVAGLAQCMKAAVASLNVHQV